MLNQQHRKSNHVSGVALATLLFITASSAMYQTPDSAYADPSGLKIVNNYIAFMTPNNSPSLLDKVDEFSHLTSKISDLEDNLATAENQIYITKVKSDLALENQRDVYVSMDQALIELSKHVGKTPYGFGDTPARWDCSGLTLWFYETYRGITLPHSATAQKLGGIEVDAPIPGDLVAFSYGNRKEAFHIGVYVGSGMFIHAKNPHADTVLETLDSFAKNNITVAYIRY